MTPSSCARISALLGLALGLSACSTLRLYPVCQFDGEVSDEELAVYAKSLDQTLELAGAREHSALLASRRYMAVSAFSWRHRELQRVWPEVGCLGNYASMQARSKYAACRSYVAESLLRNAPGIPEDAVLCFDTDVCEAMDRVPHDGQDADALIYCNGR